MAFEREEMPSAKVDASWCALAIMQWHRNYGRAQAAEILSAPMLSAYEATLAALADLDWREPSAQIKIASAQLSGDLEWSFTVAVPDSALALLGARRAEAPRILGEAARFALGQLYEPDAPDEPQEPPPTPVDGERHTVPRRNVIARSIEFYTEDSVEKRDGIGGLNLLVSCSLERAGRDGGVTLLSPRLLGLERVDPGSRPQDFLDLLRNGQLRVGEITGES